MLGHQSLTTTSIYVNVTLDGLHASMKRYGTGQVLHDLAHEPDSERRTMGNPSVETDGNPLVN